MLQQTEQQGVYLHSPAFYTSLDGSVRVSLPVGPPRHTSGYPPGGDSSLAHPLLLSPSSPLERVYKKSSVTIKAICLGTLPWAQPCFVTLSELLRRRGPTAAVEHTGLHIADVLLAGKVIQAAAVDSFLWWWLALPLALWLQLPYCLRVRLSQAGAAASMLLGSAPCLSLFADTPRSGCAAPPTGCRLG